MATPTPPPRITPALDTVIRALDERTAHTPDSLAEALRRPDLAIDDVAPWIRFDRQGYQRNLITRTARWELRLLCWRPGQTSSLHAHGPSACAFRILAGSARESILGERDRTWAPGDSIPEVRHELVHQLGNEGRDVMLSLHAYAPELPMDTPPARGKHIVIVGGGLSGIAIAVNLLRAGGAETHITVVERGPWLGRGVAFGVDSKVLRLNVPASRMSLIPDEPDDFVRWSGSEGDAGAFLPRTLYARYVVETFRDALRASAAHLRIVRDEAVAIDDTAVALQSGARLPADAVVLATGLAPRVVPSLLPDDPRIIDAWDEYALAALPRDGRILVLGSGLSALDAIAFLAEHDFRGATTIVSRRGLLPRPNSTSTADIVPLTPERIAAAPRDLRGLLRWGRDVVEETVASGAPWQHGIEAIRPHISTLWRGMSPTDRARFVKTIRPYWDVLRHRAPRDTDELVARWRAEGRIELLAGSVLQCRPDAQHVEVDLRLAGGAVATRRYDAIVRCIGPALDRSEQDAQVIHRLLDTGAAAADPAGLGIVTAEDGRVVGRDGVPSDRLFALGALRRASSWETISVPEIAAHAHALARTLLH